MRSLPRSAFVVFLLVLALGSPLGACADMRAPGPTPQSSALLVASDLDNRPFAWVDGDGTPRGRDVEMMTALARALGREIEWVRMPFAELLPAVESGRVDVVCATIGVTPERAARVLFSAPYFVTGIAVVARVGAGEPRFLEDLAGRRVLASAGTTSERALRAYVPRATCVPGVEGTSARDRLAARDVDALVMDGPAADALVDSSAGRLARLPGRLCEELYALALPKDRASLRDALDAEIARMRLAGELTALDARHGLRASERATR